MVVKVKNIVLAIATVVLAVSCQDKDNGVYWETLSVTRNVGGVDADMVKKNKISGDDKVSENMNNRINEAIVHPLIPDIEPGVNITIDSLLNRIVAEKLSDPLLARIPYQLSTIGYVYAAEAHTSVLITSHTYTGGANVNNTTSFLNFDNEDGGLVSIVDLIEFDEALLNELRKQFCLIRDISLEASAKQAGMFIAPADLEFPNEIGFTKEGVLFYFNLYEVGPRTFGITKVLIPYDRVVLK